MVENTPNFISTDPDDYHAMAAVTAIGGLGLAVVARLAESPVVKGATVIGSVVALTASVKFGRTASEVANLYGHFDDRVI